MSYVMTATEFIEKLKGAANNYKTLYIMGCFGAPMNAKNKARYTSNNSYNMQPARKAVINAASADTFGFDCVGLVKGILWGWSGNKNLTYGGAIYKANGVPDTDAKKMLNYCTGVSTDFSNIEPGEYLWVDGHCGVYIGDGLAVECTPKWANKVQITAVGNIGSKSGYNTRNWTKHGKLQFVDYSKNSDDNSGSNDNNVEPVEPVEPISSPLTYVVQSGDTLNGIATKLNAINTTADKIAADNGIANKNKIYSGQVLKIKV